ncbi:MAG: hypothetical protein WKF66_13265 [Pedobacter sp.]
MSNEVLFLEVQRFKQWWLWLILLGINGLFIYGVFKQVIGGQHFGNKPTSNLVLLTITGLMIIVTVLFANFHLETTIKTDGIYVRFFPFHLKYKYYSWDTLAKAYVRQYSPISEYGGWGLRTGLFGKGTAYNVSGNEGLQLEFKNDKRLLIGTNKPAELIETLNRLCKSDNAK